LKTVEKCWSVKNSKFWQKLLKEEKLNLLRITAWFRVVKQIASIWLFNRLLYCHSVTFYILMTAWKNFEKLNEEKLKICKRKTDLWKNLKNLEKRRNLDFESGFCTWLATTHNISYSWQSWQCSVLTIINAAFSVKRWVITWPKSNVLTPEYHKIISKHIKSSLSNGVYLVTLVSILTWSGYKADHTMIIKNCL